MIEPTWQSDDGRVKLWRGDCVPLLAEIGKGEVDAVVTDPPYGIGEHGGACRNRGRPGYAKHEKRGWDIKTPDASVFAAMLAVGSVHVVWGGNYFSDKLPPSMGWLYWRKLMGGDFSDGELAWTSRRMALREFTLCPKGINKAHPCEKPVSLMKWCMDVAKVPQDAVVADFYMGSGTTGIACIITGRRFIGVEIDPHCFTVAVERIKLELAQPYIPALAPEKAVEQELAL